MNPIAVPRNDHERAFVDGIQQGWLNSMGESHQPCLHIGCGEKHLLWAVNIDPNPSRKNWIDYPDDVHDLSRWEDGHFYSAISNHVMPAVKEPVMALREVARVLKPGGIMAHVIPDHSHAPRRQDPRFEWQYQHHSWSSPEQFLDEVMEPLKDVFRVEVCEHFPEFTFSFRVKAVRLQTRW